MFRLGFLHENQRSSDIVDFEIFRSHIISVDFDKLSANAITRFPL